jgi:hypothetical protein
MSAIEFRYNDYRDSILLFGMATSGKTYLIREFLLKFIRTPTWVYDTEQNYVSCRSDGYIVTSDLSKLFNGRMIYESGGFDVKTFEAFCKRALQERNLNLVIDETQLFTSKYSVKSPSYENIITRGRNQGLVLTTATRAPQQVHNVLLNTARHLFVFYSDIPGHIEYLAKWVSPKVELFLDPEDRRILKDTTTPRLPPYWFVYKDRKEGRVEVGKL